MVNGTRCDTYRRFYTESLSPDLLLPIKRSLPSTPFNHLTRGRDIPSSISLASLRGHSTVQHETTGHPSKSEKHGHSNPNSKKSARERQAIAHTLRTSYAVLILLMRVSVPCLLASSSAKHSIVSIEAASITERSAQPSSPSYDSRNLSKFMRMTRNSFCAKTALGYDPEMAFSMAASVRIVYVSSA